MRLVEEGEALTGLGGDGQSVSFMGMQIQLPGMAPEMDEAGLRAIAADDTVRAVLIRAEGRNFCVGQDLKEHQRTLGDADAPLPTAKHVEELRATEDGVVTGLDAMGVGVAAWRLGAGRSRPGEAVQAAAGVEMHAKPGDTVRKGQTLLTLHTATPERFGRALEALAGGLTISEPGSQASADAVARREAGVVLDRIG